jgi:hypothetical protein
MTVLRGTVSEMHVGGFGVKCDAIVSVTVLTGQNSTFKRLLQINGLLKILYENFKLYVNIPLKCIPRIQKV